MLFTPHPDSAAASPLRLPAAMPAIRAACPPQGAVPPTRAQALQHEFDALCAGFAASGGLLSADTLAARGGLRRGNGIGVVARWIVSRRVVSVHWQGAYWIPAFQLAAAPLRPHQSMAEVLIELGPVMDDWCLAHWFASANGWLAGARPADALMASPQEVWQAARVKRFALCG